MLPGTKLEVADVLTMARRHIWLLVLPPILCGFGALVYSSTVPNTYQSDMLIAIDPQRVPDAFVRSTVTLATDQRMDAIGVQVLSRTNLEHIIETLNLYPEERRTLPIDDVVALMRKNIVVRLERSRPQWGVPNGPTAFHILFTYSEANLAAEVTQLLGSLFVKQNTQDRAGLAGATNRFLEGQLSNARRELEQQERRLESFRQRHDKELPTQMQTNMQAMISAQAQVQSLVESIARDRDRRQMLERLYREAANEPPSPAATTGEPRDQESATGRAAGTVQQQLDSARSTLRDLETRYLPNHPDVARARRRVAELEPRAEVEAREATARATSSEPSAILPQDPARRENLRQMRAEIESLDRQSAFKESEERRVRSEIAEYQRRVEAVPGLESEFVALTRDYDTQQAAYRELLVKSTAAQLAANLEEQEIGEKFRIVDPARVPVRPLESVRIRYNAAGLALGLILGLGLAALLEVRDASFRSDSDVLEALSLPVLATVPIVEGAADKARRHRLRLAYSAVGVTSIAIAGYLTWALKLWNSLI